MSGLEPQHPSQPSRQTGLNQASNPASKEDVASQQHTLAPEPSALASGDTGPLGERDVSASDAAHPFSSEDSNLEGEQMRAPGEGEIAQAVRQGGGGGGGGGGHAQEPSLTADLERKAKEHEAELHRRGERTEKEIEEEENEDWTGKKADVGEALAGREVKVVLAAEE